MNTRDDFVAWALGPDRTVEEAYLAERIVEHGVEQWEQKHQCFRGFDWDARVERARQRKLNPAHRLCLTREAVTKAAEILPQIKYFSLECYNDRPVRDIDGLKFLPQLTSLSLNWTHITDLSPIARLVELTDLSVHDREAEDIRPIVRCAALRSLRLWLQQPWPLIAGLENLPHLEVFHWHGNLTALEEIPSLPHVHDAELRAMCLAELPLRDCRRLPEMPALAALEIQAVHRLDGIGRWPRIRNLTLAGLFRDLSALTDLVALTHLTLKGDVTRDLSPLAFLPELRRLIVIGDNPQDYSVLAEALRLHDVTVQGCDINKLELSTLRSFLAPWEEEFAVPEPRPLAPLRFLIVPHKDLPQSPRREDAGYLETWKGNRDMAESEGDWFIRRLTGRIARDLKHPRWGKNHTWSPGYAFMQITSLEAAEQLPKIVRLTREFLATTRYPWRVFFSVDLGAEWARDDEEDPELGEAVRLQREIRDEIDQHLEWARRRKEHEEFLEREHRLRLIEQEGGKVRPEQFAAPATRAVEPAARDEGDSGDVDAGGLLERERSDLNDGEKEHPLAETLAMLGTISEEAVHIYDRNRPGAIHLMGRQPDDG